MPKKRARIIAVANQKGGVGKSTTAVSLGAALAELGYRVLVVDLDPQGNASTGLGIRHGDRELTVYEVLAAEAPIDGAIVPTLVENLYAVPSTIDLAGAEIELVSQFSRELRLRKAMEPLREDSFDFVFLDCPPSLGLLTVNALAAAEELIVPIQCEYYALEGLGQLLRNVRLVQQNVNPQLRLTGIVMTMFDPRTKLSEQVVEEVRRFFGDRVYRTIIPRTVRLSEAPGFGQPITVYDPRSRGAESYRDLAREVAERLPDGSPLPVLEELPAVILVAPEPAPARAPRPLVREEDELEGSPTSARAPEEREREPARPLEERELEVTEPETARAEEVEDRAVDPGLTVEVASGRAGSRGGPEVQAPPPGEEPAGDWPAPPESQATVEARASSGEAERSDREHGPVGSAPDMEPGGERGQPPVMEGREDVPAPSPEPEPEREEEPPPEETPKRRWSLFRRGGSR